jgi:hypothetical protein
VRDATFCGGVKKNLSSVLRLPRQCPIVPLVAVIHIANINSHLFYGVRVAALDWNCVVTIGRAVYEAYRATWNSGANSAFALGPRKTMVNRDPVGRSHDLLDAHWLLTKSLKLNTRAQTLKECHLSYDRRSVGQWASRFWCQAPIWDRRPIFLSLAREISSDICVTSSIVRPLWREHVSAVFTYKCYWALPALSLSGPNPTQLDTISYCIIWDWISFCHIFLLAVLRWNCSNPLPHGASPNISWVSFATTVSRSICLGVGPPFGAHDQVFKFSLAWHLVASSCRAPSLTRRLVCILQCTSLVRVAKAMCLYITVWFDTLPTKVKVSVFLWTTVSWPVCPGIRSPFGTRDQFFFHFMVIILRHLQCSYCGVLSLTRRRVCNLPVQLPLGIASAVSLRSKSFRTWDWVPFL